MIHQELPKFNILDHISKLTPVKGQKNKYYCPVCNSNNLSINSTTGAYSCYTCGDSDQAKKDIREAINPIANVIETMEKATKSVRVKQIREWVYSTTNSVIPSVKVTRTDDGNGKRSFGQSVLVEGKWKSGYNGLQVSEINLYQEDKIKNAISKNETIFIVEGETCADSLTSLGIPATTNIGGSKKWLPHYSELLKGASVVLCPDRDVPGMDHMEIIAKDFPDAKWLYAYPESTVWNNLPTSNGLDLADWINDFNLTAEDVIKSVGLKKVIVKKKKGFTSEDFRMKSSEVKGRLLCILSQQLDEPNTKLLVNDLINISGWNAYEVNKIYESLNEKENLKQDSKDAKKQFLKLKKFDNKLIKLEDIFPSELAKAFNTKAESDRIDPVRILQNAIPSIASLLGSRVGIVVKEGATEFDSWIEYPVFWTVDISPPSSGKSNAQKPVWQPIKAIQQLEDDRVRMALEELKQVDADWKNRTKQEKDDLKETDANPLVFKRTHCCPKKFVFDKGQIEAILRRLSEQSPLQGTTWLADELSGLFAGLDQYKSGKKGDSIQILLESWNGKMNMSIDRVDVSDSFYLRGQTLNLCGGIQPQKAQEIWKTNDDPDGLLSRMLPAISKIPDNFDEWSDMKVDIHTLFTGLCESLMSVPETLMVFSPDAHPVYKKHWSLLGKGYLEYQNSNPAYAYFLGKQKSYVPRLALLLHCIDYVFGYANDLEVCSLSALNRAIMLSNFYCQQFRLLQTDCKDQETLDGLLLKAYQFLSTEKTVTSRQLQQRFSRNTYQGKKINASVIVEIMESIAENGYATLEGKTLTLIEDKPPTSEPIAEPTPTDTTEVTNEETSEPSEPINFKFVSNPKQREETDLMATFKGIAKREIPMSILDNIPTDTIANVFCIFEKTDEALSTILAEDIGIFNYIGNRIEPEIK